MKRRYFIQALGMIPFIGLSQSLIFKPDPFIKIYTHKNNYVIYENFKFYQSDNNIHIIEYQNKRSTDDQYYQLATYSITVPIDFKINQKSKDEFINELNKYKGEWKIFELIADNGKSNIYGQMINSQNKEKAWGV